MRNFKGLFLTCSLFLWVCGAWAQSNGSPVFFDEIELGINRTFVNHENSEGRNGFGGGIHHSFFKNKKVNLVVGLNYSQTSQVKKAVSESHGIKVIKDARYTVETLFVPVKARYVTGNKFVFFVEAGAFVNANLGLRLQGWQYKSSDPEELIITEIDMKLDPLFKYSAGILYGMGVAYRLNGVKLFIKPGFCFQTGCLWEIHSGKELIYNRYFNIALGVML